MKAQSLLRGPTSTFTSTLAARSSGQSADGDSNEMVTFVDPPAGTYTVYVHGFNTAGPSANFTLYEWQLGSTSAGNMTRAWAGDRHHRRQRASEPLVHWSHQRYVVSRPDDLQ